LKAERSLVAAYRLLAAAARALKIRSDKKNVLD
jgi:hypothetical protein